MKSPENVAFYAFLFFILCAPFGVSADTDLPATIGSDMELSASSSPYIVFKTTVPPGVTLTLDAGVVVKVLGGGILTVQGNLVAHGTQGSGVTFTSYADDSVGGDSNNDGTSTMPTNRDWQAIVASPGGTVTMSYTTVRYGQAPLVDGEFFNRPPLIGNAGGIVTLDHVTLDGRPNSGGVGIYNAGGVTSITNSNITGNEYGIYVESGTTDVHQSSIVGNGEGLELANVPSLVVDAQNNWWGDASGPQVVGNATGTGSSIFVQNNVVNFTPWLTSDPFATSTAPSVPVIIIPGILGSAQKNGVWLIDPTFHVYDNLIQTLEANGYVASTTVFTFPYDWRNSNVYTAQLLQAKIQEIKTICGCNKVDLVAHSMGGLVARQYVESSAYQSDVDHLVFLGTPQQGAPEDYLAWEGGEFDKDIKSQYLKYRLADEAKTFGYSDIYDYVKQWPITAVQQLLPVYDYLRVATSSAILHYASGYPTNTFLTNLNQGLPQLLASNIKITNIIGNTGTGTISTIRIIPTPIPGLWQDGYPQGFSSSGDHGLEEGIGDGTVPKVSASLTPSDIEINSAHTSLPTDAEAQIYKALTGKIIGTMIRKSLLTRIFYAKIHSPANIMIVAPNGKREGTDPQTGQEIDEIPGAFYSGSNTDDEYLTVPDPIDGQYQIETVGIKNGGQYTLTTSDISDSNNVQGSFTGYTLPGLQQSVSFAVSSTINATTTVIVPGDTVPPTVVIMSPLTGDYDRSQTMSVSASSTDDTGVATSTLSFAGRTITNPTNINLFYESLGTTTIVAIATDFQGNTATSSQDIRVVATASSTISDIQQAFALGWITKPNIETELVNKVNKVLKAQTKMDTITTKVNGKNVAQKVTRITMVIDQTLGKALLLDLKAYTRDKLTLQGYNLINDDLNWLLNN